jgi:hypothetical protein
MKKVIGQAGEDPERKDEVEKIVPNKQRRIVHSDSLALSLGSSPASLDQKAFNSSTEQMYPRRIALHTEKSCPGWDISGECFGKPENSCQTLQV